MSDEVQDLTLPNYHNKEEVTNFIALLDTQLHRFGAKKLRYTSQIILNHMSRVHQHIEEAQRLILVVNSIPTDAQRMGFTERKLRTAAYKFYEGCSTTMLNIYSSMLGVDKVAYADREALINALVKAHVAREIDNTWGEVSIRNEAEGYIGIKETERVFKSE